MARGFQLLTPERAREIQSAGGRAAHAKGTGRQWTPEEAREQGSRGGRARAERRRGTAVETPEGQPGE